MRIFQEPSADQLHIIIAPHFAAQLLEYRQHLNVHKRLVLIIEPAVQHLQAVHQSLGIGPEIRLPILEFIIIECRQQGFLIHPVCGNPRKHLPHGRKEQIQFVRGGSLRHHAEIGLSDAVIKDTVHVLADSAIHQRLL